MINRELELKIKRLKEFMQLWVKFHDMYKDAISRDTISSKEESIFLETKSLIARKYQTLKEHLGIASSYEDKTFDVISQLLSLKGVAAISDLSLHKLEKDWHDSYILLNRLLGELESRQESLRKITRTSFIIKKLSVNPLTWILLGIIIILIVVNYIQKAPRAQEDMKKEVEFRQGNK